MAKKFRTIEEVKDGIEGLGWLVARKNFGEAAELEREIWEGAMLEASSPFPQDILGCVRRADEVRKLIRAALKTRAVLFPRLQR